MMDEQEGTQPATDSNFMEQCRNAIIKLYGVDYFPENGQQTLVFNKQRCLNDYKDKKTIWKCLSQIKQKNFGGVLFCRIPNFHESISDMRQVALPSAVLSELTQLKTIEMKIQNISTAGQIQSVVFLFLHPKLGLQVWFDRNLGEKNLGEKQELLQKVKTLILVLFGPDSTSIVTSITLNETTTTQKLSRYLQEQISSSTTDYSKLEFWPVLVATFLGINSAYSCRHCTNNPSLIVFLSVTQEEILFSKSAVKVFYGADKAAQLTTMKLLIARLAENNISFLIILSSDEKTEFYRVFLEEIKADHLASLKHISELENVTNGTFYCGPILIDNIDNLTYEFRKWLRLRKMSTVIIVDADMPLGLHHPTAIADIINTSWFRFPLPTLKLPSSSSENNSASVSEDAGEMSGYLEETDIKNFIEQAKFWMNHTNPNWMKILMTEFDNETDTICFPETLDMLPTAYLEATQPALSTDLQVRMQDKERLKKAKPNIIGSKAEQKFFTEFKKLKLGGILISGFDTQEFLKIMRNRKCDGFQVDDWKEHFECDSIFIHQKLGIFVFEVKGSDDDQTFLKRHKTATKQLKKSIDGLNDIYKRIANDGTDCPIPIQGVTCFPNYSFNLPEQQGCESKSMPQHQKEPDAYPLLMKSLVENVEDFRNFFVTRLVEEFPLTEHAISFIAAIISYRSAVFISPVSNALETYRIIDDQRFIKKPKIDQMKKVWSEDGQTQAFILNGDQWRAVNCTEPRMIISGPPGTGKTICLLLRALAAAKSDRPGKVFVILWKADDLIRKFKRFFKVNRLRDKNIKRHLTVTSPKGNMEIGDNDDVFSDEVGIKNVRGWLSRRAKEEVIGETTLVFTGWLRPSHSSSANELLNVYNGFHHIELNNVLRGTKTIVDEWKKIFPITKIRMGHNVMGIQVERIPIQKWSQLLDTLKQIVTSLLITQPSVDPASGQPVKEQYQLRPAHLAILILTRQRTTKRERLANKKLNKLGIAVDTAIKWYLASHRIECGSIRQQVFNSRLIAVDFSSVALSYEWPVVIVVKPATAVQNDAYTIAASRCIAKLIVIECQHQS